MRVPRVALLLTVVSVLLVLPRSVASAGGCHQFACGQLADGISLSMRQAASSSAKGGSAVAGRAATPIIEHTTSPACPTNDANVGGAYDVACSYMSSACASRGLDGWLVWVWSRPVGSSGRWERTGFACRSPQQVQAATPGVTRGLVQQAFRELHFAHPVAHVQPEGNVTLVNLATYYQVRWPATGLRPGQVATVRLLGLEVQLRPRVAAYTYRFGDGSSLGPTSDAGGTYPEGRVRHTYERTGDVPVRIEAAYTGDYRLAGGTWEPIDVTVPVTGDPVTVEVREARARLEASPR